MLGCMSHNGVLKINSKFTLYSSGHLSQAKADHPYDKRYLLKICKPSEKCPSQFLYGNVYCWIRHTSSKLANFCGFGRLESKLKTSISPAHKIGLIATQ